MIQDEQEAQTIVKTTAENKEPGFADLLLEGPSPTDAGSCAKAANWICNAYIPTLCKSALETLTLLASLTRLHLQGLFLFSHDRAQWTTTLYCI